MYTDHVRPSPGPLAPLESGNPPDIGTLAPDFEWADDDGTCTRLSDLRGQPVLLTFFAGLWNAARPYQLQVYNEVLQRRNRAPLRRVRLAGHLRHRCPWSNLLAAHRRRWHGNAAR